MAPLRCSLALQQYAFPFLDGFRGLQRSQYCLIKYILQPFLKWVNIFIYEDHCSNNNNKKTIVTSICCTNKYKYYYQKQNNHTCVRAEHSTYLTALSSFASFSPCSSETGFCFIFASFSIVAGSSLKSICVPTNKNGVFC